MTEQVNETSHVNETSTVPSTAASATASTSGRERGYRKTARGIVISDKMDKTIVVEIEDRKKHALYGKVLRTTKNLKAHDEGNTAGIGDRVLIAETRPFSATKHWRLVRIVERAE